MRNLPTSYEEVSALIDSATDMGGDDAAERFAGEGDDPYADYEYGEE